MWVGLVFVACLNAGAPDESFGSLEQASMASASCEEVEVQFDGSMMQCMMFGQQRMVHWLERNGDWQIKGGYRCKLGRPA